MDKTRALLLQVAWSVSLHPRMRFLVLLDLAEAASAHSVQALARDATPCHGHKWCANQWSALLFRPATVACMHIGVTQATAQAARPYTFHIKSDHHLHDDGPQAVPCIRTL